MYVAIDVGGTNVRIASTETLDTTSFVEVRRFKVENNYRRDMQLITDALHDLVARRQVGGIGCCFAGPISSDKDTILGSPNLPDWIGQPFVSDLSREFACEVRLENDAACAALGEATYGQGRQKDFLFLIWGTGFGGTAVSQVDRRVQVRPMEAGHTILEWNSTRICGCGQAGCAEAYLGGVNIQKYLGKLSEDLTEEEWEVIDEHMAHAMINVLATNYRPLVIFGGGIAINQKKRLTRIEHILQERMKIYPAPALFVTEHADNIGLLGCLALFTQGIEPRETTHNAKRALLPSWLRRHSDPNA